MKAVAQPTAVIAEDEPLLAQALQRQLSSAWPELRIVAIASDGIDAVAQSLLHKPDVLFFDVHMPELGGLEAATQLADAWVIRSPDSPGSPGSPDEPPFPLLVFVTAHDQYALQAFEAQAVDYLLKPLQLERLVRTVTRLKEQLRLREENDPAYYSSALDTALNKLRTFLPTAEPSGERLRVIQASVGSSIYMVPVDEVLYFEAADKYVRVVTPARECLIRTPLRELVPALDPAAFWQIHRGVVVRANAIERVWRDDAGKLWLSLRAYPEKLVVSRLYANQFQAM
jgi:DNA-binding LytR/AlgR family response regulator